MEQLFRKFLFLFCAIRITSVKGMSSLDLNGLMSSAEIHSVLKQSTLLLEDEILRNQRSGESCTKVDKNKTQAIDQINNCTEIACEHSFYFYCL